MFLVRCGGSSDSEYMSTEGVVLEFAPSDSGSEGVPLFYGVQVGGLLSIRTRDRQQAFCLLSPDDQSHKDITTSSTGLDVDFCFLEKTASLAKAISNYLWQLEPLTTPQPNQL